MGYVKILGLLAVLVGTLMMSVSAVSATELTSPAGTKFGVGGEIKAESEGAVTLDGSVNVTCQKSIIGGEITNSGGSTSTVSGSIDQLTFTECGNTTVTVINTGSFEFHRIGSNTATVTASGSHTTVLTHSFFLGTTHCIYGLENTDIATLTGSGHSGKTTATLHVHAPIPETPTDGLCGNDAEWTGTYPIPLPDHLIVD